MGHPLSCLPLKNYLTSYFPFWASCLLNSLWIWMRIQGQARATQTPCTQIYGTVPTFLPQPLPHDICEKQILSSSIS